jgi:excisionase family DNA binding protein
MQSLFNKRRESFVFKCLTARPVWYNLRQADAGSKLHLIFKRGRTMKTEPQALTRREAAACLGVAIVTIDRLKAKGELPHFRVGKCVRFTAQDISEFIVHHTRRSRVELQTAA